MNIDLRYDIGNQERFLNSPICRKMLIKLGIELYKTLWNLRIKYIKGFFE